MTDKVIISSKSKSNERLGKKTVQRILRKDKYKNSNSFTIDQDHDITVYTNDNKVQNHSISHSGIKSTKFDFYL